MTVATKDWYNNCPLRTYQDFKAFFMTARNKSKGKPLRSWARLYMNGETIEVYFGDARGLKFAEITPDNVFTFTCSPHVARQLAAVTFSSSMYKAVPFMWQRVGMARYRVEHTSNLPSKTTYNNYYKQNQTHVDWGYMRTSAPEFFAGMKFNLLTGECLNKQPELSDTVNTEKRKVWLSSLRKFKFGIKARLRIGAFDPILKSLDTSRKQVPDWADPKWLNLLHDSIRDNQHPMELLQGIAANAMFDRWYYHRGNIKPADVLKAVDEICTTHSIDLRKRFGVFDEVSQLQEENAMP